MRTWQRCTDAWYGDTEARRSLYVTLVHSARSNICTADRLCLPVKHGCVSHVTVSPGSKTCFISYTHCCSSFSDIGTRLLCLRLLTALFTSILTASRSIPHTYRCEFIWRAL